MTGEQALKLSPLCSPIGGTRKRRRHRTGSARASLVSQCRDRFVKEHAYQPERLEREERARKKHEPPDRSRYRRGNGIRPVERDMRTRQTMRDLVIEG